MARRSEAFKVRGANPLPRLSIVLAAVLLARPGYTQKSTVVVTAAPSIPSNVPEFVDQETFTSAVLNSTNFYRGEHNASAVVWNETLEGFASDYLGGDEVGEDCRFAHSGGPYGENLALGYPNATASIEAWGDERKKYNFDKPGFSEQTGHFTQLVWKDTTDVGCGKRLCGEKGWYLVCEYWPRGNVIGAFKDQVDRSQNSAAQIRSGWLGLVTLGVLLWTLS